MKLSFESIRNTFLKNKILVENFTFLSVLQVSNLVLFIITIPYLFRILGSQNYGLVVFAQTTAFYFSILINFGFNLTATRDISVNRDNREKVSEIVSSVLILKFLLFIFSFTLLAFLTFIIRDLGTYRLLFLLSMMACLSEALFPVWYFQGVEKMKYITFINVTFRILATVFVFLLIRSPGDYSVYPLILGCGTVLGSIAGLLVIFIQYKVSFRIQPLSVLKLHFLNNSLYFFANVSTQIYINANRIVAGLLFGMTELAYYDIAEKIVNMLKVPYSILGQTLFPRYSRDPDIKFLNRTMRYLIPLTILLVSMVFFLSGTLVEFFSGSVKSTSVNVLRILTFSLLPISVSMFYGDIILINHGLVYQYTIMRFLGMVFYAGLLALIYFSHIPGIISLAIIVLAVETFTMFFSLKFSSKINRS